jgi:hypothetical protein
MTTTERMTPERREAIGIFLRNEWLIRDGESALDYARELFRELDAVTKERNALASAIHEACDIIETGDARNLALDGPAGGSVPQMSLAEWRALYTVLEDSTVKAATL